VSWRCLLLLCVAGAAQAGGLSPAIDSAARLPPGDDASEYWDVTALFDTGHRFHARFLITNAGPGDRNAVATGDLVDPDGAAVPFQNGRREGRWKLAPGGRALRIGSSRLDLDGRARRVEIDNDKRGFEVVLDFAEDGSASPVFDADGYRVDLLHLASPVTGRVQHAKMPEPLAVRGYVTVTHTWSDREESDRVRRRIDVTSLDAGAALFASHWTDPSGKARSWAGIARGRSIEWFSTQDPVRLLPVTGGEDGYPIPATAQIRDPEASGRLSLGGMRLQRDPLDALPTAIRMVYSFGARPRRVWLDAAIEAALKPAGSRAALALSSPGIATLNFLDSTPVTSR
jgi:hypothetical protein